MSATEIEGHRVDDSGLFDGSQYDVRPEKDGHRADKLRVAFGGGMDLDPDKPEDIAFGPSLRLGRAIELRVTARVSSEGWRHSLKGDDHQDVAANLYGLTIHSIILPEADA